MRLFPGGEGCRHVGFGGAEVVHADVRTDHRHQDERHPDKAREGAVEGGRGADGDGELRDRGAEVAARGFESERVPLLRGRVEERDVRHRAGEVASAEAGEGGDEQEHAERSCGVRHRDGEADAGDEQHGGRDDGPVATAEARNHERVGDAQRGAHQARHGDEPEDLTRRQLEAGGREQDDDQPRLPDDEDRELGEDSPPQVTGGDGLADAVPLLGVPGVPVVDPAAGAMCEFLCCCLGRCGRRGGRFGGAGR